MFYKSTRGKAPKVDFSTATLTGLAPDGGLYLPEEFPYFSKDEWRELANLSYNELAFRLLKPYVKDCLDDSTFKTIIDEAYTDFPASGAPLVQLDHQLWMLELYRGPTLAFKDYALQFLGRLFAELLSQRKEKLLLLGATSGDTGAAALAAVAQKPNVAITMLHPHNRISPIQRRQMTTLGADNIRNLAIKGTFDDCQDIVKTLFSDRELQKKLPLSSVNSINWARVMAQIVYYAKSALALGAPDRIIDFCVPSGNFGNVFAGYMAKQMGLPIGRFHVASNSNDILHRMINNNDTKGKTVVPTLSPSMDIQISSNFERLLYLLNDEDGAQTESDIQAMREGKHHQFSDTVYSKLRADFCSGMANDDTTVDEIRYIFENSGQTIDPHTAIATYIARQQRDMHTPMVVLSTAHSAKFPQAMEQALQGATPLPANHHKILQVEEVFQVMGNDAHKVTSYLQQEFGNYGRN